MNVAIAPDLEPIVEEAVASDAFESAEAVIDYALRHLLGDQTGDPEYESKLQALNAALAEGEADLAAGRYTDLRTEEELRAVFRNP